MKISITNNVGKTRYEELERRSNKKYIKHRKYYVERLVVEFETEAQSHHFSSNNYLSIEGVKLEYYRVVPAPDENIFSVFTC